MTRSSDPTRERILDAASSLVSRAPAEFTVDRVASEAGVSRATLYRRFPRSEALLDAVRAERGVVTAHDRVDVRERILDAARSEFPRHGVAGTTVQAIAEAADVSSMTVYNHFGDKEGLLEALLRERGPVSLFPGIAAEGGEPEEAVERFVAGALRLTAGKADLFRVLIAPDPVTRRAFNRVRAGDGGLEERLGGLLARLPLADGVDPRVAAHSLMGMIVSNGIFIPTMSGTAMSDPDDVARQITRIFLRGVSASGRNTPDRDP